MNVVLRIVGRKKPVQLKRNRLSVSLAEFLKRPQADIKSARAKDYSRQLLIVNERNSLHLERPVHRQPTCLSSKHVPKKIYLCAIYAERLNAFIIQATTRFLPLCLA